MPMTRISRILVGGAVGRVPFASDRVMSGPPGRKFILDVVLGPLCPLPRFGRSGRRLLAIFCSFVLSLFLNTTSFLLLPFLVTLGQSESESSPKYVKVQNEFYVVALDRT